MLPIPCQLLDILLLGSGAGPFPRPADKLFFTLPGADPPADEGKFNTDIRFGMQTHAVNVSDKTHEPNTQKTIFDQIVEITKEVYQTISQNISVNIEPAAAKAFLAKANSTSSYFHFSEQSSTITLPPFQLSS